MKTAKLVKQIEDWNENAALYELSEPIDYWKYTEEDDYVSVPTNYVIVSAINNMFGRETYMFPATSDGEAIQMVELSGSEKGCMNHKRVLNNAGYEVVE